MEDQPVAAQVLAEPEIVAANSRKPHPVVMTMIVAIGAATAIVLVIASIAALRSPSGDPLRRVARTPKEQRVINAAVRGVQDRLQRSGVSLVDRRWRSEEWELMRLPANPGVDAWSVSGVIEYPEKNYWVRRKWICVVDVSHRKRDEILTLVFDEPQRK